jgi:hypothetical protein
VNTHYAVVTFSGDPAGEHPDEELRGRAPHLSLVACGPEEFCWDSLTKWTERHPLRMWEEGEVLVRDPALAAAGPVRAAAYRAAP